ncbi:HNH endonuclease [Jiangella aurantiaca]|uniref:HNH endonuclease n=1 Tax=Jiangella aurantiaca TaxID=2530373 RepID=A0A4V2YRG0_9ACTN|nr:HNH endonuclease signature motif containing protein [Jiangella aurantiaca]TDD65947.1 HNH endonuclease [Jiangella aurantiaca]
MFEEALLTAPSPGDDPVAGRPVAWHPGLGDWVAVEPCDLVDPRLEAMLDRLAREYAAGVLPVDVDELPAGPELAVALAAFDPTVAGGPDLVQAAAGLERLEAWVAGRKAAVHAALASRPEMRPDHSGYRSVNPVTNTAVEIAARCQMTTRQAENQVGHAVQLVEDFPATHAALSAGVIDLRRARVITDELGGQDAGVRVRVEAGVLPKAPFLDSVALRKLIKQLLHELAPVETAQRHEAARDRRFVAVTPASDGMAHVEALLPAEDATAFDTALNAAAADAKRSDAAAGLPARSKDQRRADALADLGWAFLTARADAATDGGPARRPISVHVTVLFATLAGLDDGPGELDGYGPIPANVARVLAAEGVWSWLRTDPGSRQLLDLGRTKYRPTKALAEFITARDRTCRMPGCHRPARAADIDHIVPFAAGGSTSPGNLHALCQTHHLLKHHSKWTVTRAPDGTTRWTGPTGHRHQRPPEQIGPSSSDPPPC